MTGHDRWSGNPAFYLIRDLKAMGIIIVLLSSSAEYLNYGQEKYVIKTSLWWVSGKKVELPGEIQPITILISIWATSMVYC